MTEPKWVTPDPFNDETISLRTYQSGQGYESTRLHRLSWRGGRGMEPHTAHVRIVVHQGNSRAYAYAEASMWTPAGWTSIVRLNGWELPEGPSYGCWDHEDRPRNNRVDCEEWLAKGSALTLTYAKEVLR